MRVGYRIGVAVAVLAVASCAPKQRPVPEPRPPRVERPAERPLPGAVYFALAASIDLYQVRAGELALERSGSDSHRAFARRMIEEHRGLASQLSMAGRRLDLLPPNTVQPEQQGWLDQLAATASAAQFDAAYRRQQLAAHEASYRAHYAFAYGGDSPTLRLVARSAAGIEQDHARQMRAM